MKYIFASILLFIYSIQSIAQKKENDSISTKEISNIIIAGNGSGKNTQFSLERYKTNLAAFLDCDDNVGVFINAPVNKKNLLLNSVEIPVTDHTNGDEWAFNFFILIKYDEADTIIKLSTISNEMKKGKLTYIFTQDIPLNASIKGFYFFAQYVCPQKQFHGNMLLQYTEKFRSKLTYRYSNQKVILKDMKESYQVPPGTQFDKYKFLNWKVKVNYSSFNN